MLYNFRGFHHRATLLTAYLLLQDRIVDEAGATAVLSLQVSIFICLDVAPLSMVLTGSYSPNTNATEM